MPPLVPTETPLASDASLTDALSRFTSVLEKAEAARAAQTGEIEKAVADAVAKLASREPETPSRTEHKAGPLDGVSDRFDAMNYKRGDYEFAYMMFEGVKRMRNPVAVTPPEDFVRAYLHHVYETPGPRLGICAADGKFQRLMDPKRAAMDTAESGFGSQLIGAQYISDLWAAARNNDTLVGRIREIPMSAPTVYVPVDGALPEMLYVSESTSDSATAYAGVNTGSNRATLSAAKFTIQSLWSGELNEDSIIAFTPFLRDRMNMSAALHLGSAYYNGDTTNAATGNINLDDADPTDTKHYLAWNGIRKYWLITDTAKAKDMAAALALIELQKARGKLNGTDDDLNAAVGNINWGTDASKLLMVCDYDTFLALSNFDEVVTVDKYGPNAVIQSGELGRIYGIPIIAPGYATKTEADGKASTTEASNTKGQITILNPDGWLGGVRRDVQLYFDRVQRTDQFLFELYTRRAFTRFGSNVAAGIYDITLP